MWNIGSMDFCWYRGEISSLQSFHLFWEPKLWCPLITASKVVLIALQFCLTWWMLLRLMLDNFSFGNVSVLLILCSRLHLFICVSYSFSVLICPICIVSSQDNGLYSCWERYYQYFDIPYRRCLTVGEDASLFKYRNASLVLSFFVNSLLQIKPHCAKGYTDPKGGGGKKKSVFILNIESHSQYQELIPGILYLLQTISIPFSSLLTCSFWI